MNGMNKIKNRKKIGLIVIILVVIFIINGLRNDLVVTTYDIFDDKVKNEFKVVFIADTHSCKYGNDQKLLLDKIKSEKPNIILLGGDIIDDKLPMEIGFNTIKDLNKISPVFYVSGNHEIWSGKYDFIKDKIKSFGIEVLAGNIKEVKINGNTVNILGIDDPYIGTNYTKELKNLENFKSDNLNILLSHRPENIDDYKKLDIDYVFSGHAHGGQWRLPFVLERGIYAPNQGLFPKYTTGVNKIYSFKMIISIGLSKESTRIPRFYNRPEIVVVNFKNN